MSWAIIYCNSSTDLQQLNIMRKINIYKHILIDWTFELRDTYLPLFLAGQKTRWEILFRSYFDFGLHYCYYYFQLEMGKLFLVGQQWYHRGNCCSVAYLSHRWSRDHKVSEMTSLINVYFWKMSYLLT